MAYSEEQLNKLGTYRQSMADQMAKSNTAYTASMNSINAQNTQAQQVKANSEASALKTLQGNNATAYATYKQNINPYGKTASQNNYGSNVSSYLQNASYGTLLNGLGTNQATYNTAMNDANTIWTNWLASKANLESEAENTKQTYDDTWYKYYMGLKQSDDEAAEAKRQYEESLALQKAELEEEKRQFDEQLAYEKSQSSGSSSGGGGSSSSVDTTGEDFTDTGTGKTKKSTTAVGTKKYIGNTLYRWNGSGWVRQTSNTYKDTSKSYNDVKIVAGTTKKIGNRTYVYNGKGWVVKK